MKSKELFDDIMNYFVFSDNAKEHKEIRDKVYKEMDIIEKNLEVLDILKRVIFLTDGFYYIQTKKRLNEEDYKLIKECLENDK